MGSSGNGMFGTYRGGGAGSIVRGGNNGGDECPLAIENILLEDVAISEYFQNVIIHHHNHQRHQKHQSCKICTCNICDSKELFGYICH